MPAKGKAVVLGGGTFYHVRPHLALSAPAFGGTARCLGRLFQHYGWESVEVALTRMAGGKRNLVTNDDIALFLDDTVKDPEVKLVVMSAALCDFEGHIFDYGEEIAPVSESGKDQPRLKTSEGDQYMRLTPAAKILGRVRKERKDIFLVGFKTTAGASQEEMFKLGLNLLKTSSCNLVLVNDLHTKRNMILTPEQAVYASTTDREMVLDELAILATSRANLTFTRSSVVEGDPIPWNGKEVPESLRKVVNYCIQRGAYKPFNGATVGHFAAKLSDGRFITSIRKSNFNKIDETGLVFVETEGDGEVIAYGHRPSVGGQSQRMIFTQHPDVDCIVHAHCPLKLNAREDIPIREQWRFECGSHECGENASEGLRDLGGFKAVMLDKHGFNIAFHHSTDPNKIIKFIDQNWDLAKSTDGFLKSGLDSFERVAAPDFIVSGLPDPNTPVDA